MQNALQKIIDISKIEAEINGYYVGIVPESNKQDYLKMQGFLFEKGKNEELFLEKKYFNSIFEMSFMANHGSLKKYAKNELEFYDFEYKNTETEDKIKKFQQGALKFVRDYNLKESKIISDCTSIEGFLRFGNNPSFEDIENFKNVTFYDDDFFKLLPDDLSSKYLLNPKKFVRELKKSEWKTAFLKGVFRLNIDYSKLIIKFRKILKN